MLKDQEYPKISIIMAARDAEPWLADSLKSILRQTFSDFEFLIVDDASTDGTANILEDFKSCDSRIKIFTNESSRGLPANLNFLIKKAKGDYIARMDADDISHPERLEAQLAFMENNKDIELCFSEVNLMLEDQSYLCKKWSPKSSRFAVFMLPYINYFVHPTAFLKREVFGENILYNEDFIKGQDWELWQRIEKKGFKFGIVSQILLDYRLRLNSSSASLSSSSIHGAEYFIAIILIRNRYKLKSIKFFNKIPRKLVLRFIINLLTPQVFFLLAVILNSKFNTNSAAKMLFRQQKID